eukprot:6214409-Pleurochrysis_carterae.AAC.1
MNVHIHTHLTHALKHEFDPTRAWHKNAPVARGHAHALSWSSIVRVSCKGAPAAKRKEHAHVWVASLLAQ